MMVMEEQQDFGGGGTYRNEGYVLVADWHGLTCDYVESHGCNRMSIWWCRISDPRQRLSRKFALWVASQNLVYGYTDIDPSGGVCKVLERVCRSAYKLSPRSL